MDATYGVYVGEIGGWWDMPGVGSSCGYAHFLFANINAANVNLANYWYGVGAGAFWFMGGPGMDPNYGTYGGTAKEAWTWGVLQAQTALSLYNSSRFSPGFNFPVLFMDIEKATTSATTDGSNAVATPGSCGSTRLLDLWRHDGDLLHDSRGQRDALEQSAPPGSSNGPGHPAGGHPRLPQQLPSLGAGKKRVTPCPAGGWMNSGREGESGPCDRTTPEVLRGAEDVMGADPAPDDVRLTSLDFGSELPGGPTVRRERHLHDVAGALQGLHPETGPEWPTRFQILDKPGNGNTKPLLLVRAKRSPVVIESREPLVGGHLPKRVKEGVAVVEHGALFGGYLLAGFPFTGLPRVGPEPCLLSWDRLQPAHRHLTGLHDKCHVVALLDVQGLPDLSGQRDLSPAPDHRSGHLRSSAILTFGNSS